MAEFALGGDNGGHSWNNAIAHATYEENVEKFGADTARNYLRKDIRSFIQEQKGQESQWSLTVQGGRMVTETGVSLDEMTANITQGRYSNLVPENIKATAPLEAATLREATRLAVDGAEKIILPEQHLDADGNIVSRYLSVWTKNASDSTRYDGSRIDLGKNIRIEDVRTGTSFTAFEQHESISFHQHKDEKRAFVLAIHSNSEDSFRVVKDSLVTKVHRSHQETYSIPVVREGRQKQTDIKENRHADMLTEVPRAVFRDVRETAGSVSIFLRNKKEQINYDNERKSERLTLKKIREKPVRLGHVIEKRHIEMRRAVVSIAVIAETGVALHAVPVLLARLSETSPAPIRAVEKSIRRHEKKVPHFAKASRGRREVQKTRAVRRSFEKVQPLKPLMSERIEPFRSVKERRKRVKRGGEKWIKTVAAAEILAPIATEKRERRVWKRLRRIMRRAERVLESKRMPKREKKLWRALAVTAAKLASQGQALRSWEVKKRNDITHKSRDVLTSKPALEAGSLAGRKEQAAMAGVRFAFVVWALLNRANFPPVESKLAIFTSKEGRRRIRAKLVHPKGEKKGEEKELTPWVLLSIIWYMTAIREQGRGSNPTNPANIPIRPIKKVLTFPQYAVIFAYAS
ncbi:MAG: hypothetical protein AAB557_02570 [Patescibacteria group bacterium]